MGSIVTQQSDSNNNESQSRLLRFLSDRNVKIWLIGVLLILILWLLTGFYTVDQGEQGVELRFGKIIGLTGPGIHYNYVFPVGSEDVVNTQAVRQTSIGSFGIENEDDEPDNDLIKQSLMLTGDENIVDIDFKVLWQISDIEDFIYKVQDTESTVKSVSESIMREIIGQKPINTILTKDRGPIQDAVHDLLQETLNDYEAGVHIVEVELQAVNPPAEVIAAFRDVQAAKADQERIQNEAQAHANKVEPEARGEAVRILEAAKAYKEQTVADALGRVDRFSKIHEQYVLAPEVTRKRMFLETMEDVYRFNNITVLDELSGLLPHFPIPVNELTTVKKGTKR